MSEMSIYEQVQCINEMQNFISEFTSDIERSMNEFRADLDFLRKNGLTTEVADRYREKHFVKTEEGINAVIEDFKYHHYSYLEDVKDKLKRVLY